MKVAFSAGNYKAATWLVSESILGKRDLMSKRSESEPKKSKCHSHESVEHRNRLEQCSRERESEEMREEVRKREEVREEVQ